MIFPGFALGSELGWGSRIGGPESSSLNFLRRGNRQIPDERPSSTERAGRVSSPYPHCSNPYNVAMPEVNDPIRRFSLWFRAAAKRSPGPWFDPTAMTLATTGKRGDVTARIVLLKKFGPEGFTFYTNYASRKGRQLGDNPRAALVFYWPHLQRQVRIEGRIEKVSRDESDAYFHSRPRPSQIGAAASNQSEVIPSREYLVDRFKRLQKQFVKQPIPLPDTWGGYRLQPDTIEFWQHRESRLHDRFRYRRDKSNGWKVDRLSP